MNKELLLQTLDLIKRAEPGEACELNTEQAGVLATFLKARRDPACPVCGDNPTITELIDYEFFCGLTEAPVGAAHNGH